MKKQSLLIALLCVSVFSTMAFAAGNKATGPNTQGVQVVQRSGDAPASTKHVLKGVYTNGAVINAGIAANTFTALDPALTAVCPLATPCTLLFDGFATSNGSGGNRALCLTVNGSIVGACPYSGESAADGSYSAISNSEVPITFTGSISVQTLVFSTTNATVYTYRTTYSVYKP
jgi:hypothetical protein